MNNLSFMHIHYLLLHVRSSVKPNTVKKIFCWNIGKSQHQNNYLIFSVFESDAKNMAREVHEILINICKTEGEMTNDSANQFIKDLSQKSRYLLDVWS